VMSMLCKGNCPQSYLPLFFLANASAYWPFAYAFAKRVGHAPVLESRRWFRRAALSATTLLLLINIASVALTVVSLLLGIGSLLSMAVI
jgi:hypothetical protein